MPYRFDIYIGSDNGSRRIDSQYLGKVRQWADANFPTGYTLLRGQGCYGGISEDSLLVNVLSNCDLPLREQVNGLKLDLSQEAILVVKSEVDLERI
jgi:hypothetical protein